MLMQDSPVTPPQWQFQPEQPAVQTDQAPEATNVGGVQWTASEFLAHQKNRNWYLILILGAFGVSIAVYLLTGDIISSISLLVFAILLAVVAARKPRTLQYHLGDHGLQVEQKFYPYQDFKSFSVINEGAINSIMLLPLKRFATGVTMYYAPEDEQKILDVLSSELPYEERHQDPVDKFMQRIRF